MTNTARALYIFFSGFGLLAFPENNVPDEYPDEFGTMHPVMLPYITYELLRPDRLRQAPFHARIWYRSNSFTEITAKADTIRRTIEGGHSIHTGDGALRIWPDDNFLQFQPPDEPELKIAYLSMIIEIDYN